MMDFIEMLRTKPEYIRKRFALLVAGGFTAVVTLAWGVALASSGTLALNPPAQVAQVDGIAGSKSVMASVLSAASQLTGGNNKASAITVVKTSASSTLQEPVKDDRTVIPF